MRLFRNIGTLVTMAPAARKSGRGIKESDLGFLRRAIVVEDGGRVVFVGHETDVPASLRRLSTVVDLRGRTVLPGFVECHTHLVFAGHRRDEFEARVRGATYAQISRRGGGIASTVRATRRASSATLIEAAQRRVDRFVVQGVTTLESKSGYGLSHAHELRLLRVLSKLRGPKIVRTYLGLHARPPGIRRLDRYFREVLSRTLPQLARQKLCERVDIFVEKGYFDLRQGRLYAEAARSLGLKVSVHADQLTRTGASRLVHLLGESADHLIHVDAADIGRFATSEATAVLLPAADLYLRCPYPPARRWIEAGARVALATDFNPGSSPTQDLSLVGVLARNEMRMTLPEVLTAYTVGGAFALGEQASAGSIEVGKACDLVVIDADWDELFYSVGYHPVVATYVRGRRVSLATKV
jgi:imidazolonepropionase